MTLRDSNATGGLLQACPLCNCDKGTKCHNGTPLPLHPGCKPSVPTLAPPTAPAPPLRGSTNCPCFTIFILSYWLLIPFVVTVVFFFFQTWLCTYDICLSLYHSTNSSNKTGPAKRKDNMHLISCAQLSQFCRIFLEACVYSQAPSSS